MSCRNPGFLDPDVGTLDGAGNGEDWVRVGKNNYSHSSARS